ncbi:PH domain-containing protein [Hoyosella sp. YIM 151337]|uniref:PH domain-containing protein n=1 Tax=Hoyosella sp. YIM 151337 TaxID=2992742 RepID=UPI0022365414|nr:PH domain-containing protein [Hoyosella sp. YIM 151337]MCW4353448.1 PH domain-containing protein [Hoyosella sp. YIM 151337]
MSVLASPAHPQRLPRNDVQWRRLSVRVIWVDLVQAVLSLTPGAIAVWIVGVTPSVGNLWPLALIALLGLVGAVGDAMRWFFTTYRLTDNEVQRRTGVFVRRSRAVRRDRIRSVDAHAKLRHRLAGLRVVTIGAGQQTSAREAAFRLDALTRADAEKLREELLGTERAPAGTGGTHGTDPVAGPHVFARLRPWWVVYNMFTIWAYLMAAGLLWGVFWLASTFGVNLLSFASDTASNQGLGLVTTIAIIVIGAGALGVIGLGVNFFTANWNFELARVHSGNSTFLRTRRGLFSTREVNRDESRMRGLTIDEPLLWRWMGMADTNLITTGLGLWSAEQPTALVPRGPISVARHVAVRVLGEPCPLMVALPRHPPAALRRRLWWATGVTIGGLGFIAWPVWAGVAPIWTVWIVLSLWPVSMACAVVAYRALGHAIDGDYVITRSGLLSRSTSALRRDAVSTIAVRQSILQRRLELSTVSAMTAAGWGIYETPDVDANEAFRFAAQAAPGLLDPFIESGR